MLKHQLHPEPPRNDAPNERRGPVSAWMQSRQAWMQRVCCVVFVVVLFFPMLQRLTKVAPGRSLAGVVTEVQEPRFSIADWFNGRYQEERERYFNSRIGFRSYLIRTYNQIHFSVFNRIPGRRGTQIVIGKDHWLFELEYIRNVVRPGPASEAYLEAGVRPLVQLRKALEDRGIAFVLVISPSKAQIYPEYVPDGHLAALDGKPPVTDYERLMPILKQHNLPVVDGRELFLRLKGSTPYPLFAKGGTHWNHYAIFFVLEEILEKARPVLGPVPGPRVTGVRLCPPRGADRDLADLLNLWCAAEVNQPTPYAELDAPDLPRAQRPDVLLVGDSFGFTIIDALRAGRVAGKIDFLYYFRRHFDYPVNDEAVEHSAIPQTPFAFANADWETWLKSKDLVILEFNEIFSRKLGWGFPEAALAALQATDPAATETTREEGAK